MKKEDIKRDEGRRSNAGFTLIEIMIVVTILGLLATLVVVNAPAMIHRNRVKIAKTNIEMLTSKVDIFYSELGRYPTVLTELVDGKDDDGKPISIVKKVPKDPWNHDFVFAVPGQGGEDYSISSLGQDGQVGGEDRNADINSWELDAQTQQ